MYSNRVCTSTKTPQLITLWNHKRKLCIRKRRKKGGKISGSILSPKILGSFFWYSLGLWFDKSMCSPIYIVHNDLCEDESNPYPEIFPTRLHQIYKATSNVTESIYWGILYSYLAILIQISCSLLARSKKLTIENRNL
jgi:hypothetical protein